MSKTQRKSQPLAVVFVSDKTHVDFYKTFASIFSTYTTSTLKIRSQTN